MFHKQYEVLPSIILFLVGAPSNSDLIDIVIVNVVLMILEDRLTYLILLGVVELVTVEFFDVGFI